MAVQRIWRQWLGCSVKAGTSSILSPSRFPHIKLLLALAHIYQMKEKVKQHHLHGELHADHSRGSRSKRFALKRKNWFSCRGRDLLVEALVCSARVWDVILWDWETWAGGFLLGFQISMEWDHLGKSGVIRSDGTQARLQEARVTDSMILASLNPKSWFLLA
jgi:hypothetical protein